MWLCQLFFSPLGCFITKQAGPLRILPALMSYFRETIEIDRLSPLFNELEAVSKKSFHPISALSPRIKSSTYLSLRVDDPVIRRGGLILGLVFRLRPKG
jgi:hypothetical protein